MFGRRARPPAAGLAHPAWSSMKGIAIIPMPQFTFRIVKEAVIVDFQRNQRDGIKLQQTGLSISLVPRTFRIVKEAIIVDWSPTPPPPRSWCSDVSNSPPPFGPPPILCGFRVRLLPRLLLARVDGGFTRGKPRACSYPAVGTRLGRGMPRPRARLPPARAALGNEVGGSNPRGSTWPGWVTWVTLVTDVWSEDRGRTAENPI